jgi:glycosyltransferase involved in cell wall biosynthesis
MPKVSVVIPCYNLGAYLDEAVASVLQQTYGDFEIIIVNDGSTDPETVQLLAKYDKPKTRVIHTSNQGVSAARNAGIREACGKYILPLDADDKIGPRYLELAVDVLEPRPEVAIVYCERVLFGEREGLDSLPDYDPRALLVDNCIYPAALFRKADWKSVGGYSEKMIYGWEDWDFWISLSSLNKQVVKLSEPMFYYRVRNESRDHTLRFRQKIALISVMMLRHKRLYLCNLDLLVKTVCKLLLGRLKAHRMC